MCIVHTAERARERKRRRRRRRRDHKSAHCFFCYSRCFLFNAQHVSMCSIAGAFNLQRSSIFFESAHKNKRTQNRLNKTEIQIEKNECGANERSESEWLTQLHILWTLCVYHSYCMLPATIALISHHYALRLCQFRPSYTPPLLCTPRSLTHSSVVGLRKNKVNWWNHHHCFSL